MEIRLAQTFGEKEGKGKQTHFGDVLTEEDFAEIKSAVSILQEFHHIRGLLGFVVGNEQELLDYFQAKTDEWAEKLTRHINVSGGDFNNCLFESNRRLLNYLSSVRTFIDHIETYLNRTFDGRESQEFVEFKKSTAVLYDSSFGYSFFWALRDYAQHCGLPIGHIEFSWDAGDLSPGEYTVYYEFKAAFDRDALLGSYKWKKVVLEGLSGKDREFDLVPLMIESTSVIKALEASLEYILGKRFYSAAALINGYISKNKKEGGRVFVAYNLITDERGKLKNYSSVDLLEDTVNEVLMGGKGRGV